MLTGHDAISSKFHFSLPSTIIIPYELLNNIQKHLYYFVQFVRLCHLKNRFCSTVAVLSFGRKRLSVLNS